MNPQIVFLINKSLESLNSSNLDSAELYLKQALRLQSSNPHVLRLLGVISAQRREYSDALKYLNNSLKALPKNSLALSNLGNVFYELKEYSNALDAYDKSIKIDSNYNEAWYNKGNALYELKRFDEALAHYDKALSLKPEYVEAWFNKGNTLQALKRFDEALAHYDKALSLKPDYAEGWSNKAITLHELKRYEEAIAHYDRALSLKPDYAEGWSNKGLTLHELKHLDKAILHYDKALALNPSYHDASFNKSLSLLLQGDFENGFSLYNSRWHSEKVSKIAGKRFFDNPTWLGVEALDGKTILVYGEQGLGDFIQFSRYIKQLADVGAKVILETPQSLVGLMNNLNGVSQLVIQGEKIPSFDYQCPLLSLPLALKTKFNTIPNPNRYINIDKHPAKFMEWNLKLGLKSKPRIGLVWSSMSHFRDDAKRSLALQDFVKCLPKDRFEYICLQKELKESDKQFFENYKNIRFFGDEFLDFTDTAALIENLDLVISTCTSIPHLSGALNKKTWILLSYVPDWRWFLDREDSPWYSSIKLYRQPAIGDWASVLDSVKLDLDKSFIY
jgi:tetratricopeptide (TPR) repeat protein